VDGACKVIHVFRGNPSHGDAAIFCEVDTVLLRQFLHLIRCHPREAKHPNLIGNMLPIPRRPLLFQILPQFGPHRDNPIGHSLDLQQPIGPQFSIPQNLTDNSSPIDGRIRIHSPNQNLNLRHNFIGLLFTIGNNGKSTSSFSVEPHVFCIALSQSNLMAFLDEKANSLSVFIGVA